MPQFSRFLLQLGRFLRFWSPIHNLMSVRASLVRFSIIFIFIFLIILLPFLGAVNAQEIMPLNQIKPGLNCQGLTVLKGQTPQKIKMKVVGDTQNPQFHEKRLVLAEMRDGMPVIAGMSGSPVYCDGKLLGALSMQLGEFPLKAGLAGITPIGYMRDQRGSLGRKSLTNTMVIGEFHPIKILLSVSDTSLALINQFNRDMPSGNFMFVPGIGGQQEPVSQQLGVISPGDSVTILLSKGAFVAEGTCTVTEATEKTFSACGHPFLGEGEIQLPAYRSSIAHTFKSISKSFKIAGDIIEPVGTIIYDNAFGVEGVRELRPNIMVPVNLSVSVDSEHYDYRFDIFKHKFYTSLLIELGTRSLLSKIWADARRGTARLTAKIYLQGRTEPIEIYDADLITKQRTQFQFLEGYTDPWQILRKFQQTLSSLQQSEWNFALERVELTLDIWSGNRILMFDSLAVLDQNNKPTEEIRTGDKLTVVIGMRSEDSLQKLVRKFTIEIPQDLNLVKPKNETEMSLIVGLYIMSGTKYQEMDPKKLPKAEPDSAEEFLRVLRLNQRDPSEMFAVIVLPSEYQSANQNGPMFPELKSDVWNSVGSLEFLHERKTASEPRVIYLPLGTPLKDAVVSFVTARPLKLMLK